LKGGTAIPGVTGLAGSDHRRNKAFGGKPSDQMGCKITKPKCAIGTSDEPEWIFQLSLQRRSFIARVTSLAGAHEVLEGWRVRIRDSLSRLKRRAAENAGSEAEDKTAEEAEVHGLTPRHFAQIEMPVTAIGYPQSTRLLFVADGIQFHGGR